MPTIGKQRQHHDWAPKIIRVLQVLCFKTGLWGRTPGPVKRHWTPLAPAELPLRLHAPDQAPPDCASD